MLPGSFAISSSAERRHKYVLKRKITPNKVERLDDLMEP